MRASIAVMIGLLALVTSDARAQSSPPTSAAFGTALAWNVEGRYGSLLKWNASFSETYVQRAFNSTKTASGTVWFNPDPAGVVLTQDGQQTFVPCSRPSPFFFLCGAAGYSMFTFVGNPGATLNPHGDLLVATSTSTASSVATVVLYVDKVSLDVRRTMLIDGQGNRNTFIFQ